MFKVIGFLKRSRLLPVLLTLALLYVSSLGSVSAAGPAQRRKVIKLIIEQGISLPELPGLALWHDYGSFALYKASETALANLSTLDTERLHVANEMDRILIDAAPFDSQTDALDIPQFLSLKEPSGAALQLVQFVGPIKAEWLDAVRSAGGVPVHYIANNAYLVWGDETVRNRLGIMARSGDFLQYSAPYQPFFKLGPSLRTRLAAEAMNGAEVVPVAIQMYRHEGREASELAIKGMLVEGFTVWEPVMEFQTMLGVMRIADIPEIARLPDVYWIGERFERELLDEVQGQILAGNLGAGNTGPTGPGYLAWLASRGFSQNPADYPIVDITDDGIGNGTVLSGDNTLHRLGVGSNASRLVFVQNCTSALDGSGPDGHGHINASIAGGYDARSGSPYRDMDGFNLGLGVNPYGRQGGTRIFTSIYDASACGGTDAGVIGASYNAGARISSNSWGCRYCASTYDDSSQAYDVGTRDALPAQPGNQQLTFIFAAGNSGPTSVSVGSPGNAKNVITVGASENDRPTWTDGCGVGPEGANSAMDVSNFSGRGPAPGDRVKPELVAPGTHIQGTASTSTGYNGSQVCDAYHPSGQQVFASSSGTSHSSPAVAGVASLYTYWLRNRYGLDHASPAVLKAYLLAHPTYLTGANANDDLPSNNQGYGMPNMSLAFDNTSRLILDQAVVLDNSGEAWYIEGGVSDPAKPVRIVLVYSDQAGAIGTSPQVNDLNLKVELGSVTYLGNHFSGRWSTTGGSPDAKNNYEAVFLPSGNSGNLKITVTGFNIAGDAVPNSGDSTDQDFALVCYNCAQSPDFTLSATPAKRRVCSLNESSVDYQVSLGSILGFSSAVNLSLNGNPQGTSTVFSANPLDPPGNSILTISGLRSAPHGKYYLEIRGSSPGLSHETTVGLVVYSRNPAAPGPLSPADGTVDVPVQPGFTWTAPNQSRTYTLEIAPDSEFRNILFSFSGITGTSFSPGLELASNTKYYWRVQAENDCGPGNYSATFSFTTVALPGDCLTGFEPVLIFREDFESGAPGWEHGSYDPPDNWKLSTVRSHDGLRAYQADTKDVIESSDQWLISPVIQLPLDMENLILDFWNYQSIERGTSGDVCFDGGLLEISSDAGNNWEQALENRLLTDPYDAAIADMFGNPLSGKPAWCGDPQDWTRSIVSLDDYAGQSVRFRFRLGMDKSIGKEGWTIDDFVVKGCQVGESDGVQVGPDQQSNARPGTSARYDFTVTNTRNQADSFRLEAAGEWMTSLSANSTGTLQPGDTFIVTLTITVPKNVSDAQVEVAVLTATSDQDSAIFSKAQAVTSAHWWRNYLSLVY